MTTPETTKSIDERATELGCRPELVPVVERLDTIIVLLKQMPITCNHYVGPSAELVAQDVVAQLTKATHLTR